MKKLLLALVAISALTNAQQFTQIKTGQYSHINIDNPTVAVQTLASIKYAQEFHAKKNKIDFSTRINGNLCEAITKNMGFTPLRTGLRSHTYVEKPNTTIQTLAAAQFAQEIQTRKNKSTYVSEAINPNLKQCIEQSMQLDTSKYEIDIMKHRDEQALKEYKAGIRNAYLKSVERMRLVNNTYESKLKELKQQNVDLSASSSFIDMGCAETARKTIDNATDDFHGLGITRFFNTAGIKNESKLKDFSTKSKELVEEFIKIGKADVAQEYANKIEDIKDFSFFAPIKKSAAQNSVLCSYNAKDRSKLFGIMHTFKNDVKNLYQSEKQKLTKNIPDRKLDQDIKFQELEKEFNSNLTPFIKQQLDTVLCVPFVHEKKDSILAFKKTYEDRSKLAIKGQKNPSMDDGVFIYAYKQFQDLQEYCQSLISKKK